MTYSEVNGGAGGPGALEFHLTGQLGTHKGQRLIFILNIQGLTTHYMNMYKTKIKKEKHSRLGGEYFFLKIQ